MNDVISVFSGIKSAPIGESDWISVMERMKSDKYRSVIEHGRNITDIADYRAFKIKLPSVTFCGKFAANREKANIVSTTGFIVPDLDHLDNVDSVFKQLCEDEFVWFAFRSPSGTGLKCGLRAHGIYSDDDIKIFFASCERYFSETYGLILDKSCKDISRLTFVSYDPDLFINPNPYYFDIDKWKNHKPKPIYVSPDEMNNGWKCRYGQKVLDSCCLEIQQSAPGNQHNSRLRMSRLIGGYIATGFIDEAYALSCLEIAVRDSGAKRLQAAMDTIKDGIEHGKHTPLQPEQRILTGKTDDIQFYCDLDEMESNQSNQCNQSNQSNQCSDVYSNQANCNNSHQKISGSNQVVITCHHDNDENGVKKAYNLASCIREWLTNSSGSFTAEQIDREFCLTTRKEKLNRATILHRYINKKLISSDRAIKGKYQILNPDLDVVDIFSADETAFSLTLPFHLDHFVSIPKKAIVIIAGSSNAGKTALMLNILKLNLTQPYKKLYLMSEMGVGEYVDRLKKFDDINFNDWKNILASERTVDFNGAIEHHNKDGLTCIDFLEEQEGEYFKISSYIRNIYDSLGDGVGIIAIQKKTDTDYARGGQATAEKARLYMSVDFLTVQNNSIICALKIIKNKRFVQRNLQNHEIHFKIEHGAKIEAITEWTRCSDINRKNCIAEYDQISRETKKPDASHSHSFKTTEGEMVYLRESDFEIWKNRFKNLDIDVVLDNVCEQTYKKSWLEKKHWFFQLNGYLTKLNERINNGK